MLQTNKPLKSKKSLLELHFYELLYHYLKNKKLPQLNYSNYSEKQLQGYINSCIKVHKKIIENEDRNHIHSKDLKHLHANPLDKVLNVFVKNENSTYHTNSAFYGNNAYTNWYDIQEWFLILHNNALEDTKKFIEFEKRYESALKECEQTVKKIKVITRTKKFRNLSNHDEFIEVKRNDFLKIYDTFQRGKNEHFIKWLNSIIYTNKDFVYVGNDLRNNKIDKFNGLGRKYTVLNSSTPKAIRQFVLNEFTEIDINSCSVSILANLWMNDWSDKSKNNLEELKIHYPDVHALITTKQRFREKYQRVLGVDNTTVKNMITHLVYEPNSNNIHQWLNDTDLKRLKDGVLHFHDIVQPSKGIVFNQFIRELNDLRYAVVCQYYQANHYGTFPTRKINDLDSKDIKPIIDDYYASDDNKHILDSWINSNQAINNQSLSKIVAKIIVLVENQIREIVIEYLKEQGFNTIFQVHDAFLFKGDIELKKLEDRIFEKTGFIFSFSVEKY